MSNPFKSMRTYADHATLNSWEIAEFTLNNFEPDEIIAAYNQIVNQNSKLLDYAVKNVEFISTFISKTPSQRGAYFRKMTKDLNTTLKIQFLLCCINQVEKAEKAFWVRDQNCNAFIPGAGNRKTVAEMNTAITEFFSIFLNFSFPHQAFAEAGHSF